MVRMKLSKEEFDPKALDVKVEKSTFKRYRGEVPPNGTILIFRVTKMWWTQSNAGDSQIRVMAFAEQNKGSLKKYNGLPVREYLTFNPEAAFRYQNFLQNFGLTTRDIYSKMDVEAEPDQIGDIINSIGGWVVGSDDALCRIAVVRDRYNPDELRAKVDFDGWLPLDEDDEVDEPEDDDEDIDDEDEDEEDEPPARPTRASGRTSRTKASASTSRRRAEPEPEDEDDDEDEDEDEDIDDEAEEAEEADQEDDSEAEEDEPPARTRRGRSTSTRSSDTGRATSRTRPAATGRRAPATSGRSDGERTRSGSRTTTRESTRAARAKRDDPPF
jgi:hypothetical protein